MLGISVVMLQDGYESETQQPRRPQSSAAYLRSSSPAGNHLPTSHLYNIHSRNFELRFQFSNRYFSGFPAGWVLRCWHWVGVANCLQVARRRQKSLTQRQDFGCVLEITWLLCHTSFATGVWHCVVLCEIMSLGVIPALDPSQVADIAARRRFTQIFRQRHPHEHGTHAPRRCSKGMRILLRIPASIFLAAGSQNLGFCWLLAVLVKGTV